MMKTLLLPYSHCSYRQFLASLGPDKNLYDFIPIPTRRLAKNVWETFLVECNTRTKNYFGYILTSRSPLLCQQSQNESHIYNRKATNSEEGRVGLVGVAN